MKKVITVLILICLLLSCTYATCAADAETVAMADELYSQGLFSGTGVDTDGRPIYKLDDSMTREQAITMLVKFLGKYNDAAYGTWETHFTDVSDWAQPFVEYAYANGLTSGKGEGCFGGSDKVTAAQYLTFILKALGYSAETDFTWNKSWEFSDTVGITSGEFNEKNNSVFLRGDAVRCTYLALQLMAEAEDEIIDPPDAEITDPVEPEVPEVIQPVANDDIPELPERLQIPEVMEVPEQPASPKVDSEAMEELIAFSKTLLGVPYKSGGKTPDGFDCSGFVIYCFKNNGYSFTAGSCQDLWGLCDPVTQEYRQPGDIVFFRGTYSTSKMSHVGIYIGNNQMIHASTSYHGCICIVDLDERYWAQHFYSYGRMSN